jgi:hypothetical protein
MTIEFVSGCGLTIACNPPGSGLLLDAESAASCPEVDPATGCSRVSLAETHDAAKATCADCPRATGSAQLQNLEPPPAAPTPPPAPEPYDPPKATWDGVTPNDDEWATPPTLPTVAPQTQPLAPTPALPGLAAPAWMAAAPPLPAAQPPQAIGPPGTPGGMSPNAIDAFVNAAPLPPAPSTPPPPPPPDPFEGLAPGEAPAPQAKPKFDTLLPAEMNTGASLLGSSTLRAFRTCMRQGYYEHIRGLRGKRETERTKISAAGKEYYKFDPLALGTLVHVLLALFYKGVADIWEILKPIQPYYPALADEARRLVQQYLNEYAERDRRVLDVRFIEQESRYYFKKKRVKSAKKGLSICVTSRHDLGCREMPVDEGRLPPGVRAEAIAVMDHKTAAQMTQAIAVPYFHDPQVLTNELAYTKGNMVADDGTIGAPSAEHFGPLKKYVINFIGKAWHHDPEKHLRRVSQAIDNQLLDTYADDTQHWLYTELAERLFHPAAQEEATWPKSYLCRDPATGRGCPFIEVCARGGLTRYDPTYEFEHNQPMDPTALLAPEKPKKTRKKKTAVAADVESK